MARGEYGLPVPDAIDSEGRPTTTIEPLSPAQHTERVTWCGGGYVVRDGEIVRESQEVPAPERVPA